MAYSSHQSRVVVQVNSSSSKDDSRRDYRNVGHVHSSKRDHESSQVHKSKAEGCNAHDKGFTAGSHHRTTGHQGRVHSGATTRREHSALVVVHVTVNQAAISDTYKGKDKVQQQEPRQQKERPQCGSHGCSTATKYHDQHGQHGGVKDQYWGRGQDRCQSRGRGQDRCQCRGRGQDRCQSRGRGQDRGQSRGRGQDRGQNSKSDDSKKVVVVNNYYLQGSHVNNINPMQY